MNIVFLLFYIGIFSLTGYAIYWLLRYNQAVIRCSRLFAILLGILYFGALVYSIWILSTASITLEPYGLVFLPIYSLSGIFWFFYLRKWLRENNLTGVFESYRVIWFSFLPVFTLNAMFRVIDIPKEQLDSVFSLYIPFFILIFLPFVWIGLQKPYPIQSNVNQPLSVFSKPKWGYHRYRHPALLVIPPKEQSEDEDEEKEQVIIAAERRDNGPFVYTRSLVLKRSMDQGQTWSRLWYPLGKADNPYFWEFNPSFVYDEDHSKIFLFFNTGEKREPLRVRMMTSENGGETFSKPKEIGHGYISPGHGIQLKQGYHAGRMLIPAHHHDKTYAWISDDHGETWRHSKGWVSGSESEIVELADGRLMMNMQDAQDFKRHHGKLHQRFSLSKDGGETWGPPFEREHLKSSICQTSLACGNGKVYLSYPDDHYCRCRMTLAVSDDRNNAFEKFMVYEGVAAYSQLVVLADGTLLLVFENGKMDYSNRITQVKLKV